MDTSAVRHQLRACIQRHNTWLGYRYFETAEAEMVPNPGDGARPERRIADLTHGFHRAGKLLLLTAVGLYIAFMVALGVLAGRPRILEPMITILTTAVVASVVLGWIMLRPLLAESRRLQREKVQNVSAISSLLEAAQFSVFRRHPLGYWAKENLVGVLNQARISGDASLSSDDLRRLYRLVMHGGKDSLDLSAAAIDVISRFGDQEGATCLRRLAEGRYAAKSSAALRSSARRALDALERRLGSPDRFTTLLRPLDEPDSELLRAAGKGCDDVTQERELLRSESRDDRA